MKLVSRDRNRCGDVDRYRSFGDLCRLLPRDDVGSCLRAPTAAMRFLSSSEARPVMHVEGRRVYRIRRSHRDSVRWSSHQTAPQDVK